MGGFVEDQLSRSLVSLVDADSSLGREVAKDDYKVNGMEVSIDEDCSRILATRSPGGR
jgi:phosphate transport system protein